MTVQLKKWSNKACIEGLPGESLCSLKREQRQHSLGLCNVVSEQIIKISESGDVWP